MAVAPQSKAMKKRYYPGVWDAVEPSRAEAANMKARAEMMIAIRESVAAWNVTQTVAEATGPDAAADERPVARPH